MEKRVAMSSQGTIKELVKHSKSDQWQKLMHMLTQQEEEIYHIHMFWEGRIEAQILDALDG
jgi:hypothetical protein